MAKTRVIQRNIHISHRKASLVIDLIRGKSVQEAKRILENTQKKFAPIVLKLLKQAVANAENNTKLEVNKLYVYYIVANQGPTMKRNLPRAKGSADRLFKRTTHLEIVLSDDPKERELELAAIKAKKSKKPVEKQVSKVEVKKPEPKKVEVKKPEPKVETKKVVEEQPVDPELLKREQEVLKVVETSKEPNVEQETTETIIISMAPKSAEALFDNPEKNVVFYKVTPANKVLRVIVYATAPVKKVVGEFDLQEIKIAATSTIWKNFSKASVISKKEYDAYYEGKEKAHAMISKKTYKYRNPKDLSDYNMSKGPSGFQYLK